MNPFKNAKVRSVYIKETDCRWFSAVDVCAAILNCDFQKARNYYKWLKHKHNIMNCNTVRFTNRLKLEAADGKLRFTDVLNADGVLRLIMVFPSPKAEKIKLWIAKIISEGKKVTECITNALNNVKDTARSKFAALFETVRIKDFNINDEKDFYKKSDGLQLFSENDIFESCDYFVRC